MGWSCRADASRTYQKWDEFCRKQTGSSNSFIVNGERFFYENSRREHFDGAITGSICKMVSETHARKVGTFRINGDGTIARAPKVLKNCTREPVTT